MSEINKEFEEKFKALQERLVLLCKQTIGEKMNIVDKIYIYCCTEYVVQSFDFFAIADNKIRKRGHLEIQHTDFFQPAFEELNKVKELCKEYEVSQPDEIKIIYEVKTDTFESKYKYKPMGRGKLPSDIFAEWVEETRRELEPKSESKSKKSEKLISLKKVWDYKHAGLRGVTMSVEGSLEGDTLTYFIEYNKSGFFESQLIRFDLKNKEAETLFTERHIIRSIGICEDGRRYFTSFSGKLYCVDDKTGNVIWMTEAGRGNASWSIDMDEKHIYMFNESVYCIEKTTGSIVWESNENYKRSGCSIVVQGEYLYHGYSDGAIYCMNKNSGEILWRYGEGLYPREIILIGEDKILVTIANSFGEMLLLDKKSGELISKVATEAQIYSIPVVIDNLIYVGNDAGEVYCFELTEENKLVQKFRILTDSKITSTIAIKEEILWFATEKGYIYGFDKLTGKEMVKKKKGAAGPRWIGFYDGGLLILSDKGQMEFYCCNV